MTFDDLIALASKVPQREYNRDESFIMTALLFKAERLGEHALHYLRQFKYCHPAEWEIAIAVKNARAAATFARIYLSMLDGDAGT